MERSALQSENASPVADFPVIFVAGLSGAGKSTVLNVFEDMRFFAMDGLPATLIRDVAAVLNKSSLPHCQGLVIGINLTQTDSVQVCNEVLIALRQRKIAPSILFVEAKSSVLVRRYAETRRPHPLEREGLGLEQALEEERTRLAQLRERADLVLDTSDYSIHDLRRVIQKKWQMLRASAYAMKVHLISFGFKYGTPAEADMVFDLRFLPNPYFVPELKALSGMDAPVAGYVLEQNPGADFLTRLRDFLLYLLPMYEAEGRYRITLAIGCTGGRHRSVAVTQALAEALKKCEFAVSTEHRHLGLR